MFTKIKWLVAFVTALLLGCQSKHDSITKQGVRLTIDSIKSAPNLLVVSAKLHNYSDSVMVLPSYKNRHFVPVSQDFISEKWDGIQFIPKNGNKNFVESRHIHQEPCPNEFKNRTPMPNKQSEFYVVPPKDSIRISLNKDYSFVNTQSKEFVYQLNNNRFNTAETVYLQLAYFVSDTVQYPNFSKQFPNKYIYYFRGEIFSNHQIVNYIPCSE